jgi:hypothetical protein
MLIIFTALNGWASRRRKRRRRKRGVGYLMQQ